MRARIWIGILMAVVLTPRAATAEWFVFPFAAMNTGGDTTRDTGALGASVGWMGRWIGVEGEVAVSPSFFDAGDGFRTDHRQSTYSVIGLAGPKLGLWRPYALLGGGLVRSEIAEVGGLAALNDERGALHVGGGAMWDATRHIGVRGDLRYVRALDDEEPENNVFDERFAEFSYWRVGGGITFRW